MAFVNHKMPDIPKPPKRLKVGRSYKFTPLTSDGKPKTKGKKDGETDAPFKAKVEKAYKTWYLLKTPGGYHATMHVGAIGRDWGAKEV